MKDVEPITAKLQNQENNYESEYRSSLVSENGYGTTKMKLGDSNKQTSKSQSHEDDESVNVKEVQSQENHAVEILQCLKTMVTESDQFINLEDFWRHGIECEKQSGKIVDLARYRPLCKAIEDRDVEGVEDFLNKNPEALHTEIAECSQTLLHYMIFFGGKFNGLVRQYASIVKENLQRNVFGDTVLGTAAGVGNTEAAKILVSHNPHLIKMQNALGLLPIQTAAKFGHKETVLYLLSVTSDEHPNPFLGKSGNQLLKALLQSNLYGIALGLLRRYSDLVSEPDFEREFLLQILAEKPSAFESGIRLGFLEHLIYRCIPVKDEHIPFFQTDGEVENPTEQSKNQRTKSSMSNAMGAFSQKFHILLWNALMHLVPSIRGIHNTKLTNMQTFEILKILLGETEGFVWDFEQASKVLKEPVLRAAKYGISEFVHQVIKAHSASVGFVNQNGNNVFQLAVLHRQEKVFNLVYEVPSFNRWMSLQDKSGKNILHMAGLSAPSNQIAGAALQMQRELQWFKAVEEFILPFSREKKNLEGETPRELFTKEHKQLVKEGEQWMKTTAQSCTVVAALIVTVVFATAFTVPGGDSNSIPKIYHTTSFTVFAISNALAFFSSTFSVLMFLGILTSRYSENDFLEALPRKLIMGLITLFFSIAAMILAFGAATYMVFSHLWFFVFIPIGLLAFLSVTLFALLQFGLLFEMISSTYGPSIFQLKK